MIDRIFNARVSCSDVNMYGWTKILNAAWPRYCMTVNVLHTPKLTKCLRHSNGEELNAIQWILEYEYILTRDDSSSDRVANRRNNIE